MTSYDPDTRRDTPLAVKLKDLIRTTGTISVEDYVHRCLFDPEHGYYRQQTAIGRDGDFITAPEINQSFGELVGLWAVTVWHQMGAPKAFHLIEYGAGRGTLMRDALRAARLVPQFIEAAKISLCDINPVLRDMQRKTLGELNLPEGKVSFIEDLDEASHDAANPTGQPAIVIANEFLDVCPPQQYVRVEESWQSRRIGLDGVNQLQFVDPNALEAADRSNAATATALDKRFPGGKAGDIVTDADYGFASDVLGRWPRLAALFIDYGHGEPAIGDTLQAVRNHAFEHPLASPGQADLTHQVDFHAFAQQVANHHDHLVVDGPITQAEFLGRLGIMERASRLMSANPAKAADIEVGIMRLMSPQGMGTRFKAIGVRSSDLPILPGFE